MSSLSLLTSLLLLFLLLASLSPTMATPTSPPITNTSSYIRTCCARTLYSALCYSTLSPYATQIDPSNVNQVQFARFAMNATLARLRPVSARIAVLRRRTAVTSCQAALRDCSDAISEATDLVRKSDKEMVGLERMVGPEVMWRIGNGQTWLSAAITEEDTCTDGFEGGKSGGDVGLEVSRRVNKVKQMTSNALALVNALVNYR